MEEGRSWLLWKSEHSPGIERREGFVERLGVVLERVVASAF